MRNKYGKVCFDLKSWSVADATYPNIVTDIPSKDFLPLLTKGICVKISIDNSRNIPIVLPITNVHDYDGTYIESVINVLATDIVINFNFTDNEFVQIEGYEL